MSMNLDHLPIFHAVAEAGSRTRGGRAPGRQPAGGVQAGAVRLTACLNGRALKRWPYEVPNDEPTRDPATAVGPRRHLRGDAVAGGKPSRLNEALSVRSLPG